MKLRYELTFLQIYASCAAFSQNNLSVQVKVSGPRKNVSAGIKMVLDLFSYHNFTSKMWNGCLEFDPSPQSVEMDKFFRMDNAGRCNNSMAPAEQDKLLLASEELVVSSDDGLVLRDVKLIAAVEEETGCKVLVRRNQHILSKNLLAESELVSLTSGSALKTKLHPRCPFSDRTPIYDLTPHSSV